MELNSSSEDGDIEDGLSTNEYKKKKKTSAQLSNYNPTRNWRRGGHWNHQYK
jgi:hypothetical protein